MRIRSDLHPLPARMQPQMQGCVVVSQALTRLGTCRYGDRCFKKHEAASKDWAPPQDGLLLAGRLVVLGLCLDYIGGILGLYRDNGKEHGSYYFGFRV